MKGVVSKYHAKEWGGRRERDSDPNVPILDQVAHYQERDEEPCWNPA